MRRGRLTATALAVVLLGVGFVACSDDQDACAASITPTPFDALRMPSAPKPPPAAKPPAYRPPPYKPPHAWGKPYGRARPAPPPPTVTHWHGDVYRVYPDYPGYYRRGVWPIGYGKKFGCKPLQEGNPDHA